MPEAAQLPEPETCQTCGAELEWCDCWQCGGECFSYHDCGEDCCCCLNPEDNVPCDICNAQGGYRLCRNCHPDSFGDF